MMSKTKTKKSNISTLSSSSSSSSSSPPITTLPALIQTPSIITPSLNIKDKRRLQQRRNSSSPITRIDYDTNLSYNKSEFTTIANQIPIGISKIACTNSTNSLNSESITNSPGQFRKSRIPVIINSPSRHNTRRSLSARLRNNNSTTLIPAIATSTTTNTLKNSDLLFTSPPTFRKRISSSLSRDSSPGGIKYISGHYYINNINNINYNQQQKQYQRQQFNEHIHQHQLKKQQQLQQQLQYNENKILLSDTIQQQQKQNKDDFKGYYTNNNNIKRKQGSSNIPAQYFNKHSTIHGIETTGVTGIENINFDIKINEKDKTFDFEFSKRKYINNMSSLNTDENYTVNIEKENVNSLQQNDDSTLTVNNVIKTTTTTTTETETMENTIDNNMASKMVDMKVNSSNDETDFIKNQIVEENLDIINNKIDNNLIILNNKNDENDIIINKTISNGNCIIENQIKCPNGCCSKSSCSPISPIAEEEESGSSNNIVLSDGNGDGGVLLKELVVTSKNSLCCTSSGQGVKMKRDSGGMTLNLNGPSTSNGNGSNNIGGTSMKPRTPSTPKTPHTPKTPSKSNCPSLPTNSKITPKTPPVTPDSYNTYIDDDLDSVYSYSSGRSTMSCDHPYVARNGTTFSGRKMKYVVHCSAYAGQVGDDYLTPTQRAQRQLRRLKELLTQARTDLEQKDSELLRLTREVVELRLFKASLSSPEDPSNSSDAVTVREALTDLKTSQDVSPIIDQMMMLDDGIKSSPKHVLFSGQHHQHHHHHHHHNNNNNNSNSNLNNYIVAAGGGCSSSSSSSHQTSTNYLDKMSNSEMQSSFADSGHFEDMTTSHSTQDQACGSDSNLIETYEEQRAELIKLYEKKIEELIKNQDEATGELKKSHNDRIEALLQKLADINTRYADIVPDYEQAKEKIRELEKQLEDLQQKLLEHEETQKKMYLHMYQKGQEAERIARAEQIMEIAHRQPNRVSIPELLQQLQSTQDELENIRVWNSRERGECALLTAKEAISLWVLGARKTIYRRLIEAQQNKQKVDPEITLQFLKSAIYYFLTDKENSQGHLNAIESILEFSEDEKKNINKARTSK